MPDFLLSYHSIGVLCGALLSGCMTLFLLTKQKKKAATWWLAVGFFSVTGLFFGYFLAYSFYAPVAAFHRWLTVGVLFGTSAFVAFAYNIPSNDRPREARIAIPLSFGLSTVFEAWFIYRTLPMERYFDFEAHLYTLPVGRYASILIAAQFVWTLVVLARKTMAHSEYGPAMTRLLARPQPLFSVRLPLFVLMRILVAPIALLFPRGAGARQARSYWLAFFLVLVVAAINILNKTGRITFDTYAASYAVLSLLTFFFLFMVYLNYSPEPTTFMVKLVGISFVTLLLVFTGVGYITLALNESSYNAERRAETHAAENALRAGNFEALPKPVEYVLKRPDRAGSFFNEEQLVWSRAGLTTSQLARGRAAMRKIVLRRELARVPRKVRARGPAATTAYASEVLRKRRRSHNTRGYRQIDKLYTHFDFKRGGFVYEIGFSYAAYRVRTHAVARRMFYAILAGTAIILFAFPLFFRASLVNPLNKLLSGVKQVNAGDMDVRVPVTHQDEIGYLADSFNSMVASIREARVKLQDYADNLEEKVEERTTEVREKMEVIQAMKVQQDGDYFLTSLLAKPLFFDANKSGRVDTSFVIRQKKTFEFRERAGDLGGDICVTGNLKLGSAQAHRRCTMLMNGDAMGKSMQGAGGALVMGVVMNSIMARSAANKRVMNVTPAQWLTDTYHEIHGVFKSFDGTMVISATVFLVDEDTGEAWYFNAEHPASVLFRAGKASFIEEDLQLRKLGLDSEIPFRVFEFQFQPGDVLLLGSDGRDDINLTPDADYRTINEDEFLFLQYVERAGGDLHRIESEILQAGTLTDDLSILRMGFQEQVRIGTTRAAPIELDALDQHDERVVAHVNDLYERGREHYRSGDLSAALQSLQAGYAIDRANGKLNKLLGLLSFKGKDYETAVEVLNRYLQAEPNEGALEGPELESWIALSMAEKRRGNYQAGARAAERVYRAAPENVRNLVNFADLSRLLGDTDTARRLADAAFRIDPEDRNLVKLRAVLASGSPAGSDK